MDLIGLVFALALALYGVAAQQQPNQGINSQKEYDQRVKQENEKHGWGEGRLRTGDPAPDFALKRLDSDEVVRLSTFAGKKPVALIFGTYTCPIFRGQFRTINDLAGMYNNKVEFMLVYVREAHPADGLQVEENLEQGIVLSDPKALEEKKSHASTCVRDLNIKFTTLVDGMDNRVEQQYTAWPTRLYLIGKDGRVAWKSKPGPTGFIPAELALAIEDELDR
jgi:peroxiredoxin